MKWVLEHREIEKIYPNEKNPRKLSKKQAAELNKSLRTYGLCQPIVINPQGKIIGGHQRYEVLRKLGYRMVDVYLPTQPLSEEEEEELAIRLNKNIGDWDIDILANHWDPEKLCEWGFSMEELHLESFPSQEKDPSFFKINIECRDQEQLDIIEKHLASLLDDHPGSTYKVKIT